MEQAGGFDEYDLRNVQLLEKEIEMAIRAGTAKGPRPENLANIQTAKPRAMSSKRIVPKRQRVLNRPPLPGKAI